MLRPEQEEQLDQLLSSLGRADAPPDLVDAVLARISPPTHTAAAQPVVHPFVRRSVPKRGVTVNKKIIFALAAAAVVILAVITYTSRPATTGTEATIGAAQRAQAPTPQIQASDVQLADASAQEFLQSEVFDELINDENTRTLLKDASLRQSLAVADLRKALEVEAIRNSLRAPEMKKLMDDQNLVNRLAADATFAKKVQDNNVRVALSNDAFLRAIRNADVRANLARAGVAELMARPAAVRALAAKGFERAMLSPRFSEEMVRAEARINAREQARPQGALPR
jgi:hypothetical protein